MKNKRHKETSKKLSETERNAAIIIAAIAIILCLVFFAPAHTIVTKNAPVPLVLPVEGKTTKNQSKNKSKKIVPPKEKNKPSPAGRSGEAAGAKSTGAAGTKPTTGAADARPIGAAGEGIAGRPRGRPVQPTESKGTIVFMLDDAGNNLRELEPFLQFPGPLTIAVLPGLPHSKEAARLIRSRGKTVFLHQPMEAVGGKNPGPGAIYASMSRAEVMTILKTNVNEIGPIVGINNHQGSKVTMDSTIMSAVLDFCRDNKLVFLDSRTTAESIVPVLAAQKGMHIAERTIFLDNIKESAAMNKQVEEGVSLLINQKRDTVVMIGHTASPFLADVLRDNYLRLRDAGYTFSTSSDIVK